MQGEKVRARIIFPDEQMADAKLWFQRPGESSADQPLKFFPPEHYLHSLPANHLAHAGMNDDDHFTVKTAADGLDAFARIQRWCVKQSNEISALRRQCKGDGDHLLLPSRSGGGKRVTGSILKNRPFVGRWRWLGRRGISGGG